MSSERDELAQIIYGTLNSQYGDFNMPDDAADAILAAGWRPPSRKITRFEDLAALKDGAVILNGLGDSALVTWGPRWENGAWTTAGFEYLEDILLPAIVLWEPEADDE